MVRRQSSSLSPSSSPCWPSGNHPKAIPEGDRRFWLQNQWQSSWGHATAQLGRVGLRYLIWPATCWYNLFPWRHRAPPATKEVSNISKKYKQRVNHAVACTFRWTNWFCDFETDCQSCSARQNARCSIDRYAIRSTRCLINYCMPQHACGSTLLLSKFANPSLFIGRKIVHMFWPTALPASGPGPRPSSLILSSCIDTCLQLVTSRPRTWTSQHQWRPLCA